MTTEETPAPTPPPEPPPEPLPPEPPTTGEPAPLAPVAEPERIVALDVLRGVAIFGIFMVNMQFFAMALLDLFPAVPAGEAALADHLSWVIVKAFFEYKFISIFSMLFGMGMVVQMRRAEAKGRPFAPVYLRRLLVLMLIGLAHALLLWYGDILFLYAWVGLAVFLMRKLSARLMLTLGLVGVLAGAGVVACFGAAGAIFGSTWAPVPAGQVVEADAEATEPAETIETGEPSEPVEAVETAEPTEAVEPAEVVEAVEVVKAVEPTPPAEQPEARDDRWVRVEATLARITEGGDFTAWRDIEVIAYKEGPLVLALIVRAATFAMIMIGIGLGGFGFRVLGMFLLGAALMKLDFFSVRHRRWHWWLCGLGLTLGVAGELFAVSLMASVGETITWSVAMADPLHQLASFALCLGYTGAVTLLVNSGAVPVLGKLFGAVGRLALTNYLLQTVVSTALMYWWGLAWFADVPRPQQIALVVAIFAGQIVASVVWLRFFSIGPLEWVWRSLTYARAQPWRR